MKLPKKRDRIIKEYKEYDLTSLSDTIAIVLRDVEDGFLMAGLVCEEDYEAKDLIEFAKALVAAKVAQGEGPKKKGKSFFEVSRPTA